MRRAWRAALAMLGLVIAQAGPAAAQDRADARPPSAYVSLDDPELPLFEHLVARGDVEDPSPFVRPFRRSDAIRVLAAADSARPGDPAIARLLAYFADPAERQWWRAGAAVGAEGYTHARRDPLRPAGTGDVTAYGEIRLEAAAGPVVAVSRLLDQPRIQLDSDWTGIQRGVPNILCCGWRYPDAYINLVLGPVGVFYGQTARNWGPPSLPGIGVSDEGYPRPEFGIGLRTRDLGLQAIASQLEDRQDSTGGLVHRYFFAHRIDVRATRRLQFGLWETTVIAGHDREFDARYRNPLTLGVLANLYGFADRGNMLVGLDAGWRAARTLAIELQVALDDIANRSSAEGHPSRYAFTAGLTGALGPRAGWRAHYTQASSLAFRTFNPQENLTDAGVGLGRNADDYDQLTAVVTLPLRGRWLLSPELTLLRQGEGRINDPYPGTREARLATPALFIGTVERTWRAALSLSGREGPLRISAVGGFHHVVNAGNQPGARDDRFEGRVLLTLGAERSGTLH